MSTPAFQEKRNEACITLLWRKDERAKDKCPCKVTPLPPPWVVSLRNNIWAVSGVHPPEADVYCPHHPSRKILLAENGILNLQEGCILRHPSFQLRANLESPIGITNRVEDVSAIIIPTLNLTTVEDEERIRQGFLSFQSRHKLIQKEMAQAKQQWFDARLADQSVEALIKRFQERQLEGTNLLTRVSDHYYTHQYYILTLVVLLVLLIASGLVYGFYRKRKSRRNSKRTPQHTEYVQLPQRTPGLQRIQITELPSDMGTPVPWRS